MKCVSNQTGPDEISSRNFLQFHCWYPHLAFDAIKYNPGRVIPANTILIDSKGSINSFLADLKLFLQHNS